MRPIRYSCCPDIAAPKLPVALTHRHPNETLRRRAHIGEQHPRRLRHGARIEPLWAHPLEARRLCLELRTSAFCGPGQGIVLVQPRGLEITLALA